MSKRLISIILFAAMLFSLFAGCGNSSEETAPAPSEASSAASEVTSPAENNEEPTEDVSAEDPAPAEKTVVGEDIDFSIDLLTSDSIIDYPISDDPITLTLWYSMSSLLSTFMDSFEECHTLPEIESRTGINLDFVTCSDAASTEQFNLMVASGEYTDLLDGSRYTGDVTKAYEDEVIIDLTDLIVQYAPDYYSYVNDYGSDLLKRSIVSEEGQYLAMYKIKVNYYSNRGNAIRTDWLDQLGLDIPTTVDQLYDTMVAIKTEYGTDETFSTDASGALGGVTGAFGIGGYSLGQSSIGGYLSEDGTTVLSTLQSDGFREYLEYFNKVWAAGLIDQEFYNKSDFPSPLLGPTNHSFIWNAMSSSLATAKSNAVDESFEAIGVPSFVRNEGDSYNFASLPQVTGNGTTCISTQCENPEAAVSFMNYFFTRDGYILGNYGIEGDAHYIDDSGEVRFTDEIVNNESGLNTATCQVYYCYGFTAILQNEAADFYTFPEVVSHAVEAWGQDGYSQTLPTLTYTTEESNTVTNMQPDICTYADQYVLKFMLGELELNDENWATFQQGLIDLNIEEVISIMQDAYNRYISK